jgi:hypothetical protein
LSGEIRPVNRVDQRSQEKIRLLDHFVSKYNKIEKHWHKKLQLVAKIEDVATMLLNKINLKTPNETYS